jgi:bifunctional UDP-N-acetylglucosamine pyrophosphorylase/glucosamine-1-phosphate N-acetyltransferase
MKSTRAKVLHELGGSPLIVQVSRAALTLEPKSIVVVVGHQAEEVEKVVRAEIGELARFALQSHQRGTGDAVESARNILENSESLLVVLSGDVPMIRPETLEKLIEHHRNTNSDCSILTVRLENPSGYGRVIRTEQNSFLRIVEHKDASEEERQTKEINSGIYCFDTRKLFAALQRVEPANQQGEYYLTDVVALLAQEGCVVEAVTVDDPREGMGINDRRQLAELAAVMRHRILDRLMEDGVTVLDPATTYVDDTVEIGVDTVLSPGVILEGRTIVGAECAVGAGSHVNGSRLGDRVTLLPYCVLREATVEDGAILGPFCHLRPLSQVGPGAKIGNFVELKKSRIGRGAKVPHLSYVGDTTLGPDVNFGAGAITCNYDGVSKHETIVGAGAFIGTNASLVAPITVGDGAYVGAGSVITKDVPPGALAVTRAPQTTREGWVTAKGRKPRKKPAGDE